MKELINLVSEFIKESMEYFWKYEFFITAKTEENDDKLQLESINQIVKIDYLHTKLIALTSFSKGKEAQLYSKLGKFYSEIGNINSIHDENVLQTKRIEIDKFASQIRILLNDIVQEELTKINELKLN